VTSVKSHELPSGVRRVSGFVLGLQMFCATCPSPSVDVSALREFALAVQILEIFWQCLWGLGRQGIDGLGASGDCA
jgi:hypothetical protein